MRTKQTLLGEIAFILVLVGAIFALGLIGVPASGENPDTDGVTEVVDNGDGGDTGASTVSCGPGKVSYSDRYHSIYGRTFHTAGRLFYKFCYDSGPGANFTKVTHTSAWYHKSSGIDPPCAPVAGAPRIDGFMVNISGFGGYDPAPIWLQCVNTLNTNWVWIDIPDKRIYPSSDRCYGVPWTKVYTADGATRTWVGYPDRCIPLP